jgi:Ca-activated chloride channel family protein
MSNIPPESWLDAQLRETPPPESSFLERLRAIAREEANDPRLSDEVLDERLAEVPVPPDLLTRLHAIAASQSARRMVSETRLDQLLNAVAVPEGLVVRVQQAVRDEALDEALRNVAAPDSLAARARRIARSPRRSFPFWRGAAAGLLFFALGAAYLASTVAILSTGRPRDVPSQQPLVVEQGPLELRTPAEPTPLTFPLEDALATTPPHRRGIEIELAPVDRAIKPGPAGELAQVFDSGFRPFENAVLAEWKPLGAQTSDDALPNLEFVAFNSVEGVTPPLVRGFDRVFLYKHGVFPIVEPAAHPQLATSATSISTSTASFDATQLLLSEGRWPNATEVRVEDFLAAMDYEFPAASPGTVKIRTAAGPSLFGEDFGGLRPQLLQVAAQAGPAARPATASTHLTLAIDVSSAMSRNNRLDMVQRALGKLLDHLGSQDRLSIVLFNDEVVDVVEEASSADRHKVAALLQRLQTKGGSNFEVGLRQAVTLALRAKALPSADQRVVVLTDTRAGLPLSGHEAVEVQLKEAAAQGLRLDVIDLSQQTEAPQTISKLTAVAGGQVRRGVSTEQIYDGLMENLLGQSPVLATNAVIKVNFKPGTVAAYRLLGHEPAVIALGSSENAGKLRTLQAATALYEVWLLPGESDDVATAELTWVDPRTNEAHQERQRISRLQFAPSFSQSAISLQAALVAAETAEILRKSYFAPTNQRDFGNILNVAAEVNSHLAEQEQFRRFVALVRRLEELQGRFGPL